MTIENKPHVHAELIKQWADGALIQMREKESADEGWYDTLLPRWHNHIEYRVKPVPLTKPSVNPDHVHEDYTWLATDDNGSSHLYTNEPLCGDNSGVWHMKEGSYRSAECFASFVPGTCDWKDSKVNIRE